MVHGGMRGRSGRMAGGGLLALMLGCLIWVGAARAQDVDDPSYARPRGAPFFLLTDTSFGSVDEARVRLEARPEHLVDLAETDGVEVALYRVDQPLSFLRQQRNLHRLDLRAAARPEGLANTLSYLWDHWWRRVRRVWQNVFDGSLRRAVTETSPQLKTPRDIDAPPPYTHRGEFQAPPGLTEVSRMRYPVGDARPIAPPKDLQLEGASSAFIGPRAGNVYIPLGKQKPGLYVVEAAAGRHRATALLFVSDTLAVTKTAPQQFFLWAARRAGGKVVPDVEVVWSDLNGVLGSGRTGRDGVMVLDHAVPETSYAFGQDREGGVFVTENFYYDSEIHNTKLYAYTDRPLYRPGDEVHIRLYGRAFSSATQSRPLADGPVTVTVLDATGTQVHEAQVDYRGDTGGHTHFVLPGEAPSGGYDIVVRRGDDEYAAAFRVAPYVKPHFEVIVEPARSSFKTGEALSGIIRLRYPDGAPVARAEVTLSARAQILTMVDGDLAYGGLFPVQIDDNQALRTDGQGEVRFKLPPVKEPSKLILTVLASDGASHRVRSTRDLLIERAATAWRLKADRQFAAPSESVGWSWAPEDPGRPLAQMPVRWVAIHQESQTRTEGSLDAQARSMSLSLTRGGSYTVELRDGEGRLLGAAPFWVSGADLRPPLGAIDIVLDKPRYRPGDTARVLITFPEPVDDALLTLERDRVDAHGLLTDGAGVARLKRLGERQWEASMVVRADHAPNVTFSVAYVRGQAFGFQNAGIVVEQPALQVSVRADHTSYLPGSTATLDIETRLPGGQPAPAVLSVAVVDDMVYALQPELAPSVQAFFHHLRRNNVRTHSSLAFISYDEALDPRRASAMGRGQQERAVKVLERPRRDERDTALFEPAIRTDAQGKARVSFIVPDALTRWRVTAKAYGQGEADGLLGERRAYLQSDKPFFARWTSSTWLREGDQAQAGITLFNQTSESAELDVVFLDGAQVLASRKLKATPGTHVLTVDLPRAEQTRDVAVQVRHRERVVDQLVTRLNVEPVAWLNDRLLRVPLTPGDAVSKVRLPADARAPRLRLVGEGTPAWAEVADSLVDYPYGCVEQTASRMVPLALALQALPATDSARNPLRQRLYAARMRLSAMSGPDAVFGWWGRGTTGSAFLSAYAYHADLLATRALGVSLSAAHWEGLLDVYSEAHAREHLGQRTWTLWLMQDMGLPTATLTEGLVQTLAAEAARLAPRIAAREGAGPMAAATFTPAQQAVALVVARELARKDNVAWPDPLVRPLEQAQAALEASPTVLPQAVLVWSGRQSAQAERFQTALRVAATAEATVDRGLALSLLARVAGGSLHTPLTAPGLAQGWLKQATASGQAVWVPQSPVQGELTLNWTAPVPAGLALQVYYRSAQVSAVRLPLTVRRTLYRLDPDGDGYKRVPVKPAEGLRTDALYLDEVSVQGNKDVSHALVELALPPGATMEPATWGIQLKASGNKAEPIEAAIGEASAQGYMVPLDALPAGSPRVVRHLVRLGQKGQFRLPPARVWRMYQPEGVALETGPAVQTWVLR